MFYPKGMDEGQLTQQLVPIIIVVVVVIIPLPSEKMGGGGILNITVPKEKDSSEFPPMS